MTRLENKIRIEQVEDAVRLYEKKMSGEDIEYKITDEVELKDGANLYLFEGNNIESAAITYEDGTTFVLDDWQGWRPQTIEDVENCNWICTDGRTAVMLDGIPRLF